jgi:hypothetical protein
LVRPDRLDQQAPTTSKEPPVVKKLALVVLVALGVTAAVKVAKSR